MRPVAGTTRVPGFSVFRISISWGKLEQIRLSFWISRIWGLDPAAGNSSDLVSVSCWIASRNCWTLLKRKGSSGMDSHKWHNLRAPKCHPPHAGFPHSQELASLWCSSSSWLLSSLFASKLPECYILWLDYTYMDRLCRVVDPRRW